MPPWFAKLIFWPTYLWNLLLGRVLRVRHWWDSVDEHVILGARPLKRDVPLMKNALHVTGVVNMCEEFRGHDELYRQVGIEQLWLPTTDFQPPSLADVSRGVEFLQSHALRGGKVYVHCKAGRARSATVVICWLVKYRGMTLEQAQRHLLDCRPHTNAKLVERPVVQEFCKALTKKK
ncbi:MAG: dual specificity protein phosphatase family protein [Pirellula sp.]|nr:dual specificity protein phosphatase family protein [Pirellula sp.]